MSPSRANFCSINHFCHYTVELFLCSASLSNTFIHNNNSYLYPLPLNSSSLQYGYFFCCLHFYTRGTGSDKWKCNFHSFFLFYKKSEQLNSKKLKHFYQRRTFIRQNNVYFPQCSSEREKLRIGNKLPVLYFTNCCKTTTYTTHLHNCLHYVGVSRHN